MHAIHEIRQILNGSSNDPTLDATAARSQLQHSLPDLNLDAERLLCLGWLGWLCDDPDQGAAHLEKSALRLFTPEDKALAAYWHARCRLALGDADVVAPFEKVLRATMGSHQATCWFADVLWRAGAMERAEQVWSAVRANQQVQQCADASLLEARSRICQGEVATAKQVLLERVPKHAVLRVERQWLLLWTKTTLGELDQAADDLDELMATSLYPKSVLETWRRLFLRKTSAPTEAREPLPMPKLPSLSAWVNGQQARKEKRHDEALSELQLAETLSPLAPAVRYARACLGRDDFTDVLGMQPGAFLAIRCRTWIALQRFCRREISAGDLRSMLNQARHADHRAYHLDKWEQLAEALLPPTDAEATWSASQERGLSASLRRNFRLLALEALLTQSTPGGKLRALLSWSRSHGIEQDSSLRDCIGRQVLHLLLSKNEPQLPPAEEPILEDLKSLVEDRGLLALACAMLDPKAPRAATELVTQSPAARAWRFAQQLALRVEQDELQRSRRELESTGQALPMSPASALLVFEAAGKGDVGRVLELLPTTTCRHGAPEGPPQFLIHALRSMPHSADRRLRNAIVEWFQPCSPQRLSPAARTLAVEVGWLSPSPDAAIPPKGARVPEWCLHQLSVAWSQGEIRDSQKWAERAWTEHERAPAEEKLSDRSEQLLTRARPELERMALADLVAELLQLDASHPKTHPSLLVGFADLLRDTPTGRQAIEAAERKETEEARKLLATLAQQDDLPAGLAHHFAVSRQRSAIAFEDQARTGEAVAAWRESWHCWLRWLSTQGSDVAALLLSHVLEKHRQRIKDLLARDRVQQARRYWQLLESLLPTDKTSALGIQVQQQFERFREELSLDYLMATRELMRSGEIPEGWRFNYDDGLLHLRRLLSLDGDNRRLLVALIEICNDWFLDLYDTHRCEQLRAQVRRFAPFGRQLAKMLERIEATDGEDLTARAALSDLWKFRGFVADNPQEKLTLYRESLGFNPANENVQNLLQSMESSK